MDILRLVDELDDLVHNAKPVLFSDQVRIDRERIYDLLDQIRASIPEEIEQARAILRAHEEGRPRPDPPEGGSAPPCTPRDHPSGR